ncbi:hypothetical protein ISX56_00185 [Serratia ureilytica]|nr:hypothetical protein [Serratia ureilytica]
MEFSIGDEKIKLTSFERRVLCGLLRGFSMSKLAKERGCTIKTISQHKQNALLKINCKRISELIM